MINISVIIIAIREIGDCSSSTTVSTSGFVEVSSLLTLDDLDVVRR